MCLHMYPALLGYVKNFFWIKQRSFKRIYYLKQLRIPSAIMLYTTEDINFFLIPSEISPCKLPCFLLRFPLLKIELFEVVENMFFVLLYESPVGSSVSNWVRQLDPGFY